MTRNYHITGLIPKPDAYHVELHVRGRGRVDSGETPSEWGMWGLTRRERAILRRGMTASGRDRRPAR